jgi:hypothetical protein
MCAGEYLDVMVEAGCKKQSVLDRLDKKEAEIDLQSFSIFPV